MTDRLRLLGHGFDTIQISFQVWLPESLSAAVLEAQRKAKETRKPEPVALGPKGIAGSVLRHGGGGGDAIFTTGDLGELWFLKTFQRKDPWGVTAKIRALTLLCYGFEASLERMFERALGMGFEFEGYSIGRIDYRFDVLTPREFAPDEERLIRPNQAHVYRFEVVDRQHPLYDWTDYDLRCVMRGKRVQTLMVNTIGSGNQIVTYNKGDELIVTRNFTLLENYGLSPAQKDWGLWRIEPRFAGDVLKRRWNVRTLPSLSRNLQPMLRKALTRVRYVAPGQDHIPTPRRTLDPLWQLVTDAIPDVACNQPSQFPPERAEAILRAERIRARKASIVGCALGLCAEANPDPEAVREHAAKLAHDVVFNALIVDPSRVDDAVRRALASRNSDGNL